MALKCKKGGDKTVPTSADTVKSDMSLATTLSITPLCLSLILVFFSVIESHSFAYKLIQFHRNTRVGKPMVYLAFRTRCRNEALYRLSGSSFL